MFYGFLEHRRVELLIPILFQTNKVEKIVVCAFKINAKVSVFTAPEQIKTRDTLYNIILTEK
jgi:hypothetical protein